MRVISCGDASVPRRQQSKVLRVDVLLDSPLRLDDVIGPELSASQRSHGPVEVGLRRRLSIRIGRAHLSHGKLLCEDLGRQGCCNDQKATESGRRNGKMTFHKPVTRYPEKGCLSARTVLNGGVLHPFKRGDSPPIHLLDGAESPSRDVTKGQWGKPDHYRFFGFRRVI